MEHTVPSDNHAPPGVKSWQLWFSLGAGIVVWVIHLFIVYALTSLTCEWGWFSSLTATNLSGLQIVQIVITIIAAAITVIAGVFALQNYRRLQESDTIDINRHHFMARLGLGLSILFTALIVIALIPILLLPACG